MLTAATALQVNIVESKTGYQMEMALPGIAASKLFYNGWSAEPKLAALHLDNQLTLQTKSGLSCMGLT